MNPEQEHVRENKCGGQDVVRDDYHQITYKYWAFHLIWGSQTWENNIILQNELFKNVERLLVCQRVYTMN